MGVGRYNGQKSSSRSGVSGGSVSQPHNCFSPGCTRRGETERGRWNDVTRPHNCFSPGCTRRGQTETVSEFVPTPVVETVNAAAGNRRPFPQTFETKPVAPDPDPFSFNILKSYSEGGLTLARINYHGCTNYEGTKILLFRKDIGTLAALDHLDPHFLENDENGLLARFIPTEDGWKLGMVALHSLL